jgi:hypothetical protein
MLDIDYKSRSGRAKSDPSKPLNKEDIPSLEEQLKTAEEILQDLGREIDFARRQELILKEAGGKLICIFGNMYLHAYRRGFGLSHHDFDDCVATYSCSGQSA